MSNFRVGERVKIRDWKNMEKEFGSDSYGIKCKFHFSNEMKHLCGRTAVISEINGKCIELKNWSDTTGSLSWNFSLDMIKKLNITIDELQFADILTLKNGDRYVYADNYMYGETPDCIYDCEEIGDHYDNDLKNNEEQDKDIVKIERAGTIIYEREEVKEMTIAEINKALGYEVKIVKEER